ncbi:sensor domain-containing diguanylate cyclase [Crassaminicella profunda]|uniref:sensor domain-containing diguanylate cyclase n=1 Tax=Crassaminicella profunda TaxID=1286698 RepID=UPI001CA71F10|nr:diguanylate cyclase [Crassaminicella profunda]QZY55837.1 diguanylate cyclase [Crassaminicella profunda]
MPKMFSTIYNAVISLFKSRNKEKEYMKEKQKERETSLKCAEEIANLGRWEWDYRLNQLILSHEAYRILGIEKEEFNGTYQWLLENLVHKSYKKDMEEAIIKIRDFNEVEKVEFKIIKPDGEESWIRRNGMLLYDEDGNKLKLMGTVQDITDYKETELAIQENLKFLQTLIDTIPNPIFYKDEKMIYRHCNKALIEYLGLKRDEVINHGVYDTYPKELADIYYKADCELMEKKGKQIYEANIPYKDGTYHDVIFNKAVYMNQKEETKGIVGVMVDITERKKAQKKIQRLLKLKDAMAEVTHAVIGTLDIHELFDLILQKAITTMDGGEKGSILLLGKDEQIRIVRSKGYNREEVNKFSVSLQESFVWRKTNGKLDRVVIINDVDKMVDKTALLTEKGLSIKSIISAPITIEEKFYGFLNVDSINNHAFDEEDLEIMEYMRSQIEIAISKHRLYERSIYLSRYDELTNIYNRSYFEELFESYIKKAIRYDESFLLCIFDLNGLKYVNDTYGHLAGDALIKSFATTLKGQIRDSDIFARYGGDEFVGVFFEANEISLTEKFETLIRYFKNHPIIWQENDIICSFSYGFASFPKESNDYNELVKIGDERMYRYKQKIKNKKIQTY